MCVQIDALFWKLIYLSAIFYSWVIKVRYSVQRNLDGFIGPILLYVGAFLYMYQDSETCRIPTVRLLIFPQCSVCHGPYSHSAVCDISAVSSPASSGPGPVAPSADSPQLSGAQWSSVELSWGHQLDRRGVQLLISLTSASVAQLSAPPPTLGRYI